MNTTLGIPTLTEQEIGQFVLLLNEQDEPACEYQHRPQQGYCACSGKVMFRVMDCRTSILACKNAAIEVNLRRVGARCRACQQSARSCWKVVPV